MLYPRDTQKIGRSQGNTFLATSSLKRSKAFEDSVLEHIDLLYAVALRLTRNPADAEDLTQNTFVKALRFHDKFKEGTYIKAWLLTILRNTFINEYRRKARRPIEVELTGIEVAPELMMDGGIPFEAPKGGREELLELVDDPVRKAVEELPEDFREAVIMADLEDMSYKEIAEVMKCPLGTVMSRLYRGRKLLRDALEGYAREKGAGIGHV
ncbi:MAG: ECF RNA polymerase sigma factor SigR [Bacteroidetes bacterium ADurb.Bin123]|jgi:RNA polymerase sigma-70 factor (ECF subfamily)|nr:MAG: ECF RNA polymerase sigma factor SigR [Bacteroidetes bacterium ADurb.Bin123]